jgi:ubiquinone/menaquinone biosynthesis C-methylase UbiE
MEIKRSPTPSTDYDTIAERYAVEIDVRPWNALYERPTTMSLLPDVTGRDVLDTGCGAGWYSEQLAGRGARVIAIDRSARMVAITNKRLAGRMRVIEADVTDLRDVFADMSFDVVLCSLVLHYITDLTAAFSECARVLRREGVLVFSPTILSTLRVSTPSRADVMATCMRRSLRRNGNGSARCVIGAGRCAILLNR